MIVRVRRRAAIVAATAAALLGVITYALVAAGPGEPWVEVASVQSLRDAGVTYVPEANAFVVSRDDEPLALAAWSTHLGPSEPILFCRTSGWFFSPAHGEQWDRHGSYAYGPAPRGLDRLAVRVSQGIVYVDPTSVSRGEPPGDPVEPPQGHPCTEGYVDVAPGIVERAD